MAKFTISNPAWGSLSFEIKDAVLRKMVGKAAPVAGAAPKRGRPGRKPGVTKVAGKVGRDGKKTVKQQILALIQAEKSIKLAEIKKQVTASGPTLWKALMALIKAKLVVKSGRGVYALKGAKAAPAVAAKPGRKPGKKPGRKPGKKAGRTATKTAKADAPVAAVAAPEAAKAE